MRIKLLFFLSLITLLFSNCSDDENDTTNPEFVELTFDFQNDTQSWEGDFADYPVGEEDFYELSYEFSYLPTPLNTNLGALKQSGNNHSDDLFMFIRRQLNELEPNTDYTISYEIQFASDVADGQFGVGGSPGEGVTIKAGAGIIKPEKVNQSGFYQMNIDKNNQANSGSDMVVIGDFSNDTNQNEYTLKNLVANDILTVSTNSSGELWLVVGTDSGFEATTTIFYNLIKVKLEKQ
tara:strand:+ start:1091 stop:1798 length:708 start_codon:yes stop_codon:yes gene_type:complete